MPPSPVPGPSDAALPHTRSAPGAGGPPPSPLGAVPASRGEAHQLAGGSPLRDRRRAGPWLLDPTPLACRRARAEVRTTLVRWRLDLLVDTAELLVSELDGNALTHGEGPLRLSVELHRSLLCRVADGGSRLPRLHVGHWDEECGRGLRLVDRMAADWGVESTSWGKQVWFELPATVLPGHGDPHPG